MLCIHEPDEDHIRCLNCGEFLDNLKPLDGDCYDDAVAANEESD